MSRYRPPQEKSSPYITAEGYARLRGEYDQLWRERRPEVVKALAAAAAEGDRSENAEYIYRKKELREIDSRVRYLQLRLPILKVIDQPPTDQNRVYFGAWIDVDDGSATKTYRIVGADELDPPRGHVSVDSPLARALLKRAQGEVVPVQLPAGAAELEIVSIYYE